MFFYKETVKKQYTWLGLLSFTCFIVHQILRRNCMYLLFDIAKVSLCLLTLLESSFLTSALQVQKPLLQTRCVGTCNAGTCIDGQCVCPPGWTGTQCESCYGRVK